MVSRQETLGFRIPISIGSDSNRVSLLNETQASKGEASRIAEAYRVQMHPLLIALGDLKLSLPRTDPKVSQLDQQIAQIGLELVRGYQNTPQGTVIGEF